MDLQIIIPPLIRKIEQYADSQNKLSGLLEKVRENAKQNPEKSKELLTEICSVEDTVDSIIARKILPRQNISTEMVRIKYFVIEKFDRKLHKQTKRLKNLNESLFAPVRVGKLPPNSDAAEVPAKDFSNNTLPQKSFKDTQVLLKPSISGVGRESSALKDSDESHHQSWEEGAVPVVLEELVSKRAQSELISRRTRQLLILKANLEYPSDAIFLWTSYHSYDTKQHFQFRCWVCVSKEPGERNILKDIWKQVPSKKQEEFELSNQLLMKRLHDFLAFKRYLIVLYGVLRDDVWNNLKSAFPYSLNGSRVLLISKGNTPANVSGRWLHQQPEKCKDYLQEESRILGMKDIMTGLSQSILNQHKLLFLISIVGVAESEKSVAESEKSEVAESEKSPFLWAMYNAEDIKQLFQYRAWVNVRKEFEEKNLLANILKQVTDNEAGEENLDPVTLQKKLCNFLAPKRYLIVLYDVWTADVWDNLKEALPNSMNGSRVILTVREANVAQQTNSSWIFGTVSGKELLHEKVSNLKVKHMWGRLSDVKANELGLVGLDDKVQELAELLLDSYQFLISVLGKAGSGKTMLVKAVYNSLAIKQQFDCRAFVSVSQVYEERKLLADLSMQLGMVRKDESWPKEELQRRLKFFLAWKRYLIVLDDVYTPNVWKLLNLESSSNGSRVILTTRDVCVPRHIEAHTRIIQLRLLNDDESWALFKKKVPEFGKNPELEDFKEKILQGCGGLPLNIVVLGGLLSKKELNKQAWSKVIDQVNQKKERKKRAAGEDGLISSGQPASLYMEQENVENFIIGQSNSLTRRDSLDTKVEQKDRMGEIEEIGLSEVQPMHEANNEDQERLSNQLASSDTKQKEDNQNTSFDQDQQSSSDETFSNIVDLGYQHLDSQLKFCLNYLGLFPKSYKVPFRRLFQLLQAEGLVAEDSEEQVKRYIEDLKTSSMIEVVENPKLGSPKAISMQSTIYDALSPEANEAGLFHIHFNHDEQDASKQDKFIRRFAEHPESNYKSLPKLIFQLRSYISFQTGRGDRPASRVDKLLKEIAKGGFGLIVILDLEGVYKPVLSKHIGKFPNLKYLGLRWTFLDSIPDSVGDLPCLETLDVKHTTVSTLPGKFWKAKHLQHLFMNNICVDTSIPKTCQTNGSLTKLKTLLGLVIRNKNSVAYLEAAKDLRKLGVTCYKESIEEMIVWISKLTKLQSLKLRSIDDDSSLTLPDLSHLRELSQLYLFGKLPEDFDLGKFPPNLEILTLAVSELSHDPMKELGKLKRLKILRLHAGSYKGEIMTCDPRTFTELEVLELWMLEELKGWMVQEEAMPKLKKVEIRCCKQLGEIDGLKELTSLKEFLLTRMEQDFVKKLKERLGSNVAVIEENEQKFSPTREKRMHKEA